MMEIFWENFKLISGISQKSHSKNRLCWKPFDDDDDDDDDELFLGYGWPTWDMWDNFSNDFSIWVNLS